MNYVQRASALANSRENLLSQLSRRLVAAQQALDLARARQESEFKVSASGSLFGVVSLGMSDISIRRLLGKNNDTLNQGDLGQLIYNMQGGVAALQSLSVDQLQQLAAGADTAGEGRKREMASQALGSTQAALTDVAKRFELSMPASVGFNAANFGS